MAMFDLGYSYHEYKTNRPSYRGTSLQELFAAFPNEDACLEHILKVRFLTNGCPKCGGYGEWYRLKGLRSYRHRLCHSNRSPTANTLFNRTRIPLNLWFYAMLHFSNSTHGVSRTFLSRHIGIADYPAFQMAQRIRYHMAALDRIPKVGGDSVPVFFRLETLRPIIRNEKGKHNSARILIINDGELVRTAVIGHSSPKYVRMALFEKAHRSSKFITNCTRTFKIIDSHLNYPMILFQPSYFEARDELPICHFGFFKYFQSMLRFQHIGVSYHRLWLYLKEAEFRYSRRKNSKSTFWDLLSQFPDIDEEIRETLQRENVFGVGVRG